MKALAILLFLFIPLVAMAAPGTVLQDSDGTPLKRCSTGTIKVWGFIHVGKANVFMGDCDKLKLPFSPPVALRFAYSRDVPGHAFTKSARAMLKRNLDDKEFGKLAPRIDAFDSHYQDTSDGDAYYLVYRSDDSLTLYLNDKVLAREHGAEFAHAYFRIWFGPDPYSDGLKQELLTADSD